MRIVFGSIFSVFLLFAAVGCSSGDLQVSLIPALGQKKTLEGVADTMTFQFSGPVLQEKVVQEGISFGAGEAVPPALIFNNEADVKQLEVRISVFDKGGKVVGIGVSRSPLALSELQLPVLLTLTEKFALTTNLDDGSQSQMSDDLLGHRLTPLRDGRILITGGTKNILENKGVTYVTGGLLSRALLYDPSTGLFEKGPVVNTPRAYHTATLLDDGRVLISGGVGLQTVTVNGKEAVQFTALDQNEIYDPKENKFIPLPTDLKWRRAFHTATKLSDGTVMLIGGIARVLDPRFTVSQRKKHWPGQEVRAVELFDPKSNKVETVAVLDAGAYNQSRFWHKAVAFRNDAVLVIGGVQIDPDGNHKVLSDGFLLSKSNGRWQNHKKKGVGKARQRYEHQAILMELGGKEWVIVAGGRDINNHPIATVECWNARGEVFVSSLTLKKPRYGHKALQLPEQNTIMIMGGVDKQGAVLPVEQIAVSAGKSSPILKRTGDSKLSLLEAKGRYQADYAINSVSKRILVVGGARPDDLKRFKEDTVRKFQGVRSAEIFTPAVGNKK